MFKQQWRCNSGKNGISEKAFVTLNHIGVTQGIKGARSHIDEMGKDHDQLVKSWKNDKEVSDNLNQ